MLNAATPIQGVDSHPPFATGAQRLKLLYGLPLTGCRNTILVMGSKEDADAVFDRTIRETRIEVASPGARPAASGLDVVALPGCLTSNNAEAAELRIAPQHLLRLAYAALRPGGIVIGHLDHLASAHGLRHLLGSRIGLGAWIRCRGVASGAGCRKSLVDAGFVDVECFFVEPRISAPMAAIPVHRAAARSHFLRAIRRTQGQYSTAGFWLRMALAGAGLGGVLQPHLFFWARRPC